MNEKTANEVVLGELGWWPMKARRDMIRLRYWRKLLKMSIERLPKVIYEWEREMDDVKVWIVYKKNYYMNCARGNTGKTKKP